MALISGVTIHVDTGRWCEDVVVDASVELPVGTVTALIGESGCGKSMLARAVNGSLPETAEVVAGRIEKPSVGYVPQDGREAFDAHRPVGDQLASLGDQSQVAEASAAARYPSRSGDLRPDQHSGGQIQRAALTAALLKRPRLLIIDEPSASLDTETAIRVWETIKSYPTRVPGAAVLVVTHDVRMMVSLRVADWLIIMRAGRIFRSGRAEAVLGDADTYVRGFLDTWMSR